MQQRVAMSPEQQALIVEFATRLKSCWWILPKETQEEIVKILTNNPKTVTFGPGSDSYVAMLKIVHDPTDEMMKRVYEILNKSSMLKISQKRGITLAYFVENASFLLPSQIDLLAGIVAHMCPSTERYTQSSARIIGSAFAHGADLDAFQLFSDLLKETLRVNKVLIS